MENNNFYLQGIVDRFEGNQAVIIFNGQKITWPKNKLPADIKEGAGIKLQIHTDESWEKQQEKTAKKMLNEILQNNNGHEEDKGKTN